MKKILKIRRFVVFVKKIESNRVRDRCHLTGKCGPSHSICNINITQQQRNRIPCRLRKFSNYDCHMFFMNLVD